MTKLKKVNVLSFAKFQAVSMAIVGLIMGIFTAIIGAIWGSMLNSLQNGINSVNGIETTITTTNAGAISAFAGMGFLGIIVLPLLYAGAGFVIGALGALFYNLVAKWVGGIEIELE